MDKVFYLPTLSGAERLFVAIFPGAELSDIPSDIEETMEIALASLDEHRSQMIRLYYWQGLSCAEISKQNNSSPETVRKIIKHGLSKLKDKVYAEYKA